MFTFFSNKEGDRKPHVLNSIQRRVLRMTWPPIMLLLTNPLAVEVSIQQSASVPLTHRHRNGFKFGGAVTLFLLYGHNILATAHTLDM